MIDYLPIFYEWGYTRKEVLALPHWEIQCAIQGYYRQEARKILALSDGISLGAGMFTDEGKYRELLDSLMIKAGYKQKEVNSNWAKELISWATAI